MDISPSSELEPWLRAKFVRISQKTNLLRDPLIVAAKWLFNIQGGTEGEESITAFLLEFLSGVNLSEVAPGPDNVQ